MLELIMDIAEYQSLTGITVATNNITRVTAQIARTQKILESMLGFTLDETLVDVNEYAEIGKTQSECPCITSVDIDDLDPADAVVFAYRMFTYNNNDKWMAIDPCTAINKVKLVIDGVTVMTLAEFEDYRYELKGGIIKYLERIKTWCSEYYCDENIQLAVDANWVWPDETDIPDELKYVWAEMVTFYSDPKYNIKSETLGPHSYSKFDNSKPEFQSQNIPIIKKYSGPDGSINKTITI